MREMLIFVIGAFLFLFVAWLLVLIFEWLMSKKLISKQLKSEEQECCVRHREKRRDWNRRVQSVKRHLAGVKDWCDSEGKAEFVAELFWEEIPIYLWYEFERLTIAEAQKVVDFFWDGSPNIGDIECHHMLRIRNAQKFTPELLGKFALEQIGRLQFWETIDGDGFPTGTILFSAEGFYDEKSHIAISVA